MYFSKSALLSFALIGVARAVDDIDLLVKTSIDGSPFGYQREPALNNIPCGGSRTIGFKVDYKYDGDDPDLPTYSLPAGTTLAHTLEDRDYVMSSHTTESVLESGFAPFDGDREFYYTFKCTPYTGVEGSCKLDFIESSGQVVAEADTTNDEASTFAKFSVLYSIPLSGGISTDSEMTIFSVGCETDPVVLDDPHLKTWAGAWYDYMGECDMVFLDAPNFDVDMPMKIHIRTKARYDYSFVEAAAVQIGDERFEVGSWGQYFLNGVEGAALPNTISGYKITKVVESEKIHRFYIHIDNDEMITFKVYKDWVSVGLEKPKHSRYDGANGLLGSHDHKGALMGRDGTKFEKEDSQNFAEQWQVQADEPMLFQTIRAPQAPQQCIMPSTSSTTQRRLGEQIARDSALKACEQNGWSKPTIEMCVHDVMATGDLELAAVGAM